MTSVTPTQSDVRGPLTYCDFEQRASEVLQRFGLALRELLAATPGGAERAAELSRTLKIHGKLAWQVHRVAFADNPLAEAGHVPGRAALERFLAAARQRGTPEEHIQAVREAREEYDRLIRCYARNRGEFDSMLSGLAGSRAEQVELTHRRAAFRAQSHFLGIQARTHYGCFIYHPSSDDAERFDGAVIRGMIDLRRLRREAVWVLTQTRASDNDAVVRQPVVREPLDPRVEAVHGVNVLEPFCSQPLPRFERLEMGGGFTSVVVRGDSIGNASSMTCFVGDVFRRAFGRYVDEHNRTQASQALIRTPCELLVLDVLVHKSLGWQQKPWLSVLSDHRGVDPIPLGRECDRLSVPERIVYLGKGVAVGATGEVPRYEEMLHYAMRLLGWNPDEFDVYRCRMEYPIMPSSVVLHFDLPVRPQAAQLE